MNRLKAFIAVFLVLAMHGLVFAQSKAPLTVIASEGPAQVVVNGRMLGMAHPSLTMQLAPGRYDLVVKKGGKPDFRQTINLGPGGLTVQANFGGAQRIETKPLPPPQVVKQLFTLSVSANAPGAQVSINGSSIGHAPANATLEAGTYQITVTAPGYEAYQATIPLSGNVTHMANLRQMMSRLSISANINGAEVFINGVKAGNTPFAADMAPGSYNVRVAAPGFQDYNAGVVVSGPQNLSVSLVPMMSTITVAIPGQNMHPGNSAVARIELYVDGNRQNGFSAQVPAGQRRIRVVSGGLSGETVVNVEPGRSYTIEPLLSLNIR